MMKEFSNKTYKNEKILFLILNVLLGVLLLFALNVRYETNDDWYLSLISQGFFGRESSQYLIYSNVLLGYFLKPLYLLVDSINWYVCLQVLLLSISGYTLWRSVRNGKPIMFSISINILFWLLVLFNAIVSIQYTKSAGIISVVGLFSMYWSHKNNDRQLLILGFILSLFGFLYRMNSFILSLPFICAVVLIDVIKNLKTYKIENILLVKKALIFILILISAFLIDKIHYSSDSWKEFNRFNAARTKVVDYNYLPYDENIEIYESIKYSKNDWKMIMQWLDDDVNKFTAEKLEYAINQKNNDYGFINIKEYLKFLIQNFNINNTIMFISLLLLPLIALMNKSSRIEVIIILAIDFLILLFLFYFGRYPDRVLYIINSCHVVSFIYLITKNNGINKNYNDIYLLLIILIFLCFAINIYKNKKIYPVNESTFIDVVKEREGNYIVDISYDNVELQNEETPYISSKLSKLENCDFIYSWVANTPVVTNNRINRKINVSPYKQLLNNNTYLITRTENHVKLIETYLKENYNWSVIGKYIESIYYDDKVYLVYAFEPSH